MRVLDKKREENDYIILEIKEGILYGSYKSAKVDLEKAKEILKFRLKYTNYQTYCILMYDHVLVDMNKEARDFLAKNGSECISRGAMVLESPLNRALGNFFLFVSRPKVPVKLFKNKKEALKWLKEV